MDGAALRTYLVEDNPVLRENLAHALEELTCVKVIGSSGAQEAALRWLAANATAWDLLIVDIFLKQGSGIELVQQLSRAAPHQKVVVLSNYVNPSVRKRCAQLAVDAVFDKSTEIDALVDYCALHCAQQSAALPGPPKGGETDA